MYKKFIMSLMAILLVACLSSNGVFGREVESNFRITIDIPSRVLSLYQGSRIVKQYPVAVGKSYSQTPIGTYKVINKAVNPYYKKKDIVGGSPYNPLGERWIGFKPEYGIHGNSNPDSIGTFASAGCVRMYERDVKEIYEIIGISAPVDVKYELIKTYYDVDGENPVLAVYPDYYSKEKDVVLKVEEKLKELGIIDKINPEKLKMLKNQMKNEKVLISDQWTFFINGNYITNNIVIENNLVYICKDKLAKFFKVKINEVSGEGKVSFLDRNVGSIKLNETVYVSLAGIQEVLGGTLAINNEHEVIDYTVNYITLNNKLIAGGAEDLRESPKVPILPLSRELGVILNSNGRDIEFQYEGTKLSTEILKNQHYISSSLLTSTINCTVNVYTLDKKINLTLDPIIVHKDVIYKGKIQEDEVFIPYEIITKEFITNTNGDDLRPLTANFVGLQSLDVQYINSKAYVRLNDINDIMESNENTYITKIYLKRRII